eukprot:SAG11_NODE_6682_length_1268_cov_1.667808_1_plen_183_part_00
MGYTSAVLRKIAYIQKFRENIPPNFLHAAGWGHHSAKTNSKMVPLSFYHRVFRPPIKFLPDVQGKKKASILKLRNFCDQFWNLQLKGYLGLYFLLWIKSTVIWAEPSTRVLKFVTVCAMPSWEMQIHVPGYPVQLYLNLVDLVGTAFFLNKGPLKGCTVPGRILLVPVLLNLFYKSSRRLAY